MHGVYNSGWRCRKVIFVSELSSIVYIVCRLLFSHQEKHYRIHYQITQLDIATVPVMISVMYMK